MTSIAAKARAAALSVEAKKHALRQQQDGCWILTMKVHQNDMPEEIMKAAMGQRYVCALVAVDDNEEPKGGGATDSGNESTRPDTKPRPVQSPGSAGAEKVRRSFDEMSPAQQAGMLCADAAFRAFLRERFDLDILSADEAADIVRGVCLVSSRREIGPDNFRWNELISNYRAWQREAEVVPA